MLPNSAVAARFANHRAGKATTLYTDGDVIYSFGEHFPIAVHLPDGTVLFNDDRYLLRENHYSQRTQRHQNEVRGALWGVKIIACNTEEIQRYIALRPSVLIMKRRRAPSDLDGVVDDLCSLEHGRRRFPKKRYYHLIRDEQCYLKMMADIKKGGRGNIDLMEVSAHRFQVVYNRLMSNARKGDREAIHILYESCEHSKLTVKQLKTMSNLFRKAAPGRYFGLVKCGSEVYHITQDNGWKQNRSGTEKENISPGFLAEHLIKKQAVMTIPKKIVEDILADAVLEAI